MNQENRKSIFDKVAAAPKSEDSTLGNQDNTPSITSSLSDEPKKDFLDPFQLQQQEIKKRSIKPRVDPLKKSLEEETAEKTNAAINSPNRNISSELEEMDKITPEDLKLAEQMMFKGYTEFDITIPQLPNIKLTICSTSAEEMNMLEEIVFDMMRKAEDLGDGTINLPNNHVQSMRNALFIALSYRGMNKEELMKDTSYQLNTIKKGIIRITELQDLGEVKKADEFKESLKKKLIKRASTIKRLATPLLEFISSEKYKFDEKMLRIMSTKNILPKS